MKKFILAAALAATAFLASCSSDADVASANLSHESDNFKVNRRIVFFNGITDNYLMTVEGLCSIKADMVDKQLEVTCKTGPKDQFKKHFFGLSDNVSYFVEQLEPMAVSTYRYKVVFKPAAIIPDIDAKL